MLKSIFRYTQFIFLKILICISIPENVSATRGKLILLNPNGDLLLEDTLPKGRIRDEELLPNNIVFLLDISYSMGSGNKMDLLIRSMQVLMQHLKPVDRVALLTFGNQVETCYSTHSFMGPDSLSAVLKRIHATASATNINGGVQTAYETAIKQWIRDGNNEVYLVTDGEFLLNQYTINLVDSLKQIQLTCVIVGLPNISSLRAVDYVQHTLRTNLVTLVDENMDADALLVNIRRRSKELKRETEVEKDPE